MEIFNTDIMFARQNEIKCDSTPSKDLSLSQRGVVFQLSAQSRDYETDSDHEDQSMKSYPNYKKLISNSGMGYFLATIDRNIAYETSRKKMNNHDVTTPEMKIHPPNNSDVLIDGDVNSLSPAEQTSKSRKRKVNSLSPLKFIGKSSTYESPETKSRNQIANDYAIKKRSDMRDFMRRYESILEEKEKERETRRANEWKTRREEIKFMKERLNSSITPKSNSSTIVDNSKHLQKLDEQTRNEMIRVYKEQLLLSNSLLKVTIACRIEPLSNKILKNASFHAITSDIEASSTRDANENLEHMEFIGISANQLKKRQIEDKSTSKPEKKNSSSKVIQLSIESCIRIIQGEGAMAIHVIEPPFSPLKPRQLIENFTFDHHYFKEDNLELHSSIGKSIVQCAIFGINTFSFSYGASNCGKSNSIFGEGKFFATVDTIASQSKKDSSSQEPNQRSHLQLEDLQQDSINQMKSISIKSNLSSPSKSENDRINQDYFEQTKHESLIHYVCKRTICELNSRYKNRWEIHISLFELYCNMTRDLLNTSSTFMKDTIFEDKSSKQDSLKIQGVARYRITSVSDLKMMLRTAWNNRSWSSTNNTSTVARSHVIFKMYVSCSPIESNRKIVLRSRTCIMDLAGNETAADIRSQLNNSKISKQMDRQIDYECRTINHSLQQLRTLIGRVFQISEQEIQTKSFPLRQDPLTWILKDILTPNSKIFVIGCISQKESNVKATLQTLRCIGEIQSSCKRKPYRRKRKEWRKYITDNFVYLASIYEDYQDIDHLISGAVFIKENISKRKYTLLALRRKIAEIVKIILEKEIEFGEEIVNRILEESFTSLRRKKDSNIFMNVLAIFSNQFDRGHWTFVDYTSIEQKLSQIPEEIRAPLTNDESLTIYGFERY